MLTYEYTIRPKRIGPQYKSQLTTKRIIPRSLTPSHLIEIYEVGGWLGQSLSGLRWWPVFKSNTVYEVLWWSFICHWVN